jgi:hypothetical protein
MRLRTILLIGQNVPISVVSVAASEKRESLSSVGNRSGDFPVPSRKYRTRQGIPWVGLNGLRFWEPTRSRVVCPISSVASRGQLRSRRRAGSPLAQPWAKGVCMRCSLRARGSICVLSAVVFFTSQVGADPRLDRRRDCAVFEQRDAEGDNGGVIFRVANSCAASLSCSVSWQLVCSPEGKKRERHPATEKFTLTANDLREVTASAEACGSRDWQIRNIVWQCRPVE